MRALLTGVSGFVGPHVVECATREAPGATLYGLLWGELEEEARGRLAGRIELLPGDVTDPPSLRRALAAARPEVVLHLAAASSVARSWEHAARALQINAVGTVNLLQAIHAEGLRPLVVVASSAEIYGRVAAAAGPVGEGCPLQPVSPYGTSKAAQDLLAAQLGAALDLPVIRLRAFHLTGPGRPPHFVASSFARQIARIERGLQPPRLAVGNLEPVRDFTDVRDAARAWWLVAAGGDPGEAYNLCSGSGVRIAHIVEALVARSSRTVQVEVDPALVRDADIPWLVGDPRRLREATGWTPAIPLERTLADLLEWWRSRV